MLALPQRRRHARDGAALTRLPHGRILQVALDAARLVRDVEDLLYLLGGGTPQVQLLLNGMELFRGLTPLQQLHNDEHILRSDDHHLAFEPVHPELALGSPRLMTKKQFQDRLVDAAYRALAVAYINRQVMAHP
eukprot:1640351-Pyramimonas_sp.AAC.1